MQDSGCTDPLDSLELEACSDGLDNDLDGFVDFGADEGCTSAADPSERDGPSGRFGGHSTRNRIQRGHHQRDGPAEQRVPSNHSARIRAGRPATNLGLEGPIADTAHRLDVGGPRAELFTKPLHVCVDRSSLDVGRIPPHPFEKRIPRLHSPRAAGQIEE